MKQDPGKGSVCSAREVLSVVYAVGIEQLLPVLEMPP